MIFLLSGFQCQASWYFAYANALAEAGFIVIQYDKSEFDVVDDIVEMTFVKQIKDWVLYSLQQFQEIQINAHSIGIAGHSRGGKIAALLYADDDEETYISTVYLIDPVDSTKYTPASADFPSAVQALAGKNKTLGLTGSDISGMCNPKGSNYLHFWNVVNQQSSSLQVVQNSGHMQFCEPPKWFKPILNYMCGYGSNTAQETINLVLKEMTPWMLRHVIGPGESIKQEVL
eukprot:TRINITY_DN6148_c0_g1_i6.p4 TRINITY_DN6148_c0_g1~~TRINITY_DN6148_c0_g1_i6.p4  ORF type:complete len:230 (-),score=11.40 TRINITY_DN6148_c0_g1_i6:1471-2160(-)